MRVGLGASTAADIVTLGGASAVENAISNTSAGANCIREIPTWCSWIPFADFMDTCQPYTNAELHNLSVCSAAQVAAVNPDLAAQGVANADQSQGNAEGLSPADTCQRNAAVNHPTLSGFLGPNLICAIGGGGEQGKSSYTPYVFIGLALLGGVYFFGRISK